MMQAIPQALRSSVVLGSLDSLLKKHRQRKPFISNIGSIQYVQGNTYLLPIYKALDYVRSSSSHEYATPRTSDICTSHLMLCCSCLVARFDMYVRMHARAHQRCIEGNCLSQISCEALLLFSESSDQVVVSHLWP